MKLLPLTPQRIGRVFRRRVDGWVEGLRERLEMREERRLLANVRAGRQVCWDDEPEPLVTVRIATFDRGPLIAERAIASALRQTYRNLEILVVGDACDEPTARAIGSVDDPRLRFVNLPTRGIYPAYRANRRKVAGTHPMNAALYLARGAWIAPLDDDDEFTDDHVASLLETARQGPFELVYSRSQNEARPGEWTVVGSWPPRRGEVVHGAMFYCSALRFMRHSNTCWKLANEPSDWNLFRRMQAIGVRTGYLPQVTYKHYLGAGERERIEIARRLSRDDHAAKAIADRAPGG